MIVINVFFYDTITALFYTQILPGGDKREVKGNYIRKIWRIIFIVCRRKSIPVLIIQFKNPSINR
ncbi:hypothetical protein BB552_18740 [Escherichia coli]|nr:hypothetical protein [Escherichia coli]EFA3500571.1 hypothetical protein [Escherichia coli]EFB2481709.1 hypothetical protein [Escherichia coli]EFE8650881.1 hypothetical protein [Escherichia coli]EFN5147322.1 hypothetical protein [Escherichia coli]